MDDISEQRGNFLAEAPAVLEAVQACLSGTPASQFRGGSSIMKKMWKYFAGKNWDSSLESGKQREYFLHQGQQKA